MATLRPSNELLDSLGLAQGDDAASSISDVYGVLAQYLINLPFLLCLAVLLVAQTAGITKSVDERVRRWDTTHVALVSVARREELLRRVDRALSVYEGKLLIQAFRSADRVHYSREAFPDDAAFRAYCEATGELSSAEALVMMVYGHALEEEPKFYDPIVVSEHRSALGLRSTPAVLTDSDEDQELRQSALDMIRGRVDEWQARVLEVQRGVVRRYLETPGELATDDANPAQLRQKVERLFQESGYPLLKAALSSP